MAKLYKGDKLVSVLDIKVIEALGFTYDVIDETREGDATGNTTSDEGSEEAK